MAKAVVRTYAVNLPAVLESEYPQVLKDAAYRIMKNDGYMRVGFFLSALSDEDLQELLRYSNAVIDGNAGDVLDYIVVLSDILAQAEGTVLEPDATRCGNLMTLIVFEDMARKGVIDFFRENVTLSFVGAMDETIAKLR